MDPNVFSGSCFETVDPLLFLWMGLCLCGTCSALFLWILRCSCGTCSATVDPALFRGSCSASVDSSLLLWHLLCSCGSCSVPVDRAKFLVDQLLFLRILLWFCRTCSKPWFYLHLILFLWLCSVPMAFGLCKGILLLPFYFLLFLFLWYAMIKIYLFGHVVSSFCTHGSSLADIR